MEGRRNPMIDYVTFYMITAVIAIHYIADFVFQPRAIAKLKGEDLYVLTFHTTLYSWVFYILSMVFILPLVLYEYSYPFLEAAFVVYIFGIHWGTDYITSRLSSRFWKAGREKAFRNTIGLDQAIHLVSIFGLLAFMNSF